VNKGPRTLVAIACALAALLAACSSKEKDAAPTPSGTTPPASPATPPPTVPAAFSLPKVRIKLSRFVAGLSNPLFVTSARDGSGLLYAVQQGGRVAAVDASGRRRGTFLDVSGRVSCCGERGLLGLAFHPGYKTNRRLFVDYTDRNGDTVIAEFRASSPTRADPGSHRRLLRIGQPYENHNGGMLAFGPDGYLYIAMGDGGSQGDPRNNGQSLDTLLGKILRLDVDQASPYSTPSTNPFVGRRGARREIWDYGLRNPWRFSFDRANGAMFIGDVGQKGFEEINVEPAGRGGRNYGWHQMEGDRCYTSGCRRAGKVTPIAGYSHSLGCSVTGGYVYRGSRYPTLNGAYFYADYCSGRIWAMDAAAALRGTSRVRQLLDTGLAISSFGEDESGELYLCDLGGAVYRLQAA
jgi:glucose/arabinose dehydrogenase